MLVFKTLAKVFWADMCYTFYSSVWIPRCLEFQWWFWKVCHLCVCVDLIIYGLIFLFYLLYFFIFLPLKCCWCAIVFIRALLVFRPHKQMDFTSSTVNSDLPYFVLLYSDFAFLSFGFWVLSSFSGNSFWMKRIEINIKV